MGALTSAHAQFRLHEGPYFPELEESTAPAEGAPADLPPAPDSLQDQFQNREPLGYSQEQWNKARDQMENGVPEEQIVYSSMGVLISTAPPAPRPPEVVLPEYGTSLSVTGRKIIGFNFSNKSFLSDQSTTGRIRNTSLFAINQQLQIRMQGKVGPKITVNVDYDDTKPDKQDISVVYQGDPQEVVQQASFGDIDLSLPATEFVSYNKQLFGIRANLKWQSASAILIASRTKGQTKVKEFIGNSQFQAIDIPDTNYIRRQYYDLTFGNPGRLPLQVGSERVYLDLENAVQTANTSSITVVDANDASVTWGANFQLLGPGVDYTIDYNRGILTLRVPAQQQYVLAVDFTNNNGTRLSQNSSPQSLDTAGAGRCTEGPVTGPLAYLQGGACPRIIKTNNDIPITLANQTTPADQVGYNREIKTVYSVGRSQIVRDNGRGNFILRILDQSRNDVGASLTPPQVYPATINVDFEQGLVELTTTFPEPDIYAPTPISHRLVHVEFNSRLKTFILEPSVVPQSDNVVLDGVVLQRNVDYFIDYDVGFVTFFNPDRIGPSSKIDITYDVSPFGGIGTESLIGGRVGWSPSPHWAIGSTFLYDAASQTPTAPSINDIPRSLFVMEGDTQLKDLNLGHWLKASFGLEVAQSRDNPNQYGYALIDNMEGVKQENDAALDQNSWTIAANPNGQSYSGPADPQAITWNSFLENTLDIFPNASVAAGQQQLVMNMNYNFGQIPVAGGGVSVSSEVSTVFTFSPAGLDFSQKTFLEVVMKYVPCTGPGCSGNGPAMNFHLGTIDEDPDGTGGMTLFCANGTVITHAPKTEDTDCTGLLTPAKDIGWLYAPAGKNSARYTPGNGKLDSQDFAQNGRLMPEDLSGCSLGYAWQGPSVGCTNALFPGRDFHVNAGDGVPPNQWLTFDIPLNISSATIANWTAIREIRVSMRKDNTGIDNSGSIQFARVAVVGNSYLAGQTAFISTVTAAVATPSTGTLTVGAVNNVTTPGYIPIFNSPGDGQTVYNELYGSVSQQQQLNNTQNVTEQALSLQFAAIPSSATAFTKRIFPRALDMSTHGSLRFLLFGCAQNPAPGSTPGLCADPTKVLYLRFGTDTDYWEVDLPMTSIPPGQWKLFGVDMKSSANNGIADTLSATVPGMTVQRVGNPNLQAVGEMVAGLYNNSATDMTGSQTLTLWLDEVHVAQPLTRVGNAQMAKADFEVPGWMTFGGKHRYLDRNFQTPVSVVTGQDNQLDNGYLNFKKLSAFPMNFTVSRQVVVTPNVAATGNTSNLVNLLQEGTVTTWKGNGTGNFSYGSLPKLGLIYDRERDDYSLLTREDDRKTYTGTFSYGVPGKKAWAPRTVDLNYTHSLYTVSFLSDEALFTPGNFNTQETTDNMGGKLSFAPWAGTTIQPSYSLKLVNEHRTDLNQTPTYDATYPKETDETVGLQTSWQLAKWLKPTANYTVTTIENNNLSTTTFQINNPDGSSTTYTPNIGDIKTINRNATGSINLPLAVADLAPNSKLFRSMNIVSSYQLQDGDVWQNVEKELNPLGELWLRNPLHPTSPAATEANLTLRDTYASTIRWSPLEGYGLPGRWSALKTLGLTDNFNYSLQRSVVTGTPSRTTNLTLPDLVVTLSKVEQLLHTERWMQNTQTNFKFTLQTQETQAVSRQNNDAVGMDLHFMFIQKYDTAFSVNVKDSVTNDLQTGLQSNDTAHQDATLQTTFNVKKWRLTPKVDYTNDETTSGGIVSSSQRVITPSVLARADLNLPEGLKLPFMSKPFIFTNRIIWTTNASFAMTRSPVTEANNFDLLNLSTSADYELATNLRMTINGNIQREWHLFLPQEEFISYQLGTTLTFQF